MYNRVSSKQIELSLAKFLVTSPDHHLKMLHQLSRVLTAPGTVNEAALCLSRCVDQASKQLGIPKTALALLSLALLRRASTMLLLCAA